MNWFVGSLLLLVTGTLIVGFTNPNDPMAQVKGYRKWHRVTENPVDMSPRIALSCIGPTTWDQSPNPHVPKVFLVYVNKIGQKAMEAKGIPNFPDGTVIVKEKYSRNVPIDEPFGRSQEDTKALLKKRPELCTVMAKTDGKWQYFALDSNGKLMEGDTKYCAKCHEVNSKNDFVFRPYVPEAALAPRVWR